MAIKAISFIFPLRIVQLVFAVIVLGLTSYVASQFNESTSSRSPDQVNFLLFCSVWTMLIVVPLTIGPKYVPEIINKWTVLAAEAVTMIFWFSGFIALAVMISGYGWTNWCRGPVCQSMQAATVFGAFEWVVFAVTTALAAIHVVKNRNSSSNKAAPEIQAHPGV